MKHSSEGKLLTKIILEVFKLNGLLIAEGDQLTKELGLSSARWKILGALYGYGKPMTVPEIARTMGQTRQAVQRLANEMNSDGLLDFQINPKHKRAKLLVLSCKGKKSFELLEEKQIPWVNTIADEIDVKDLQNVSTILLKVMNQIEK